MKEKFTLETFTLDLTPLFRLGNGDVVARRIENEAIAVMESAEHAMRARFRSGRVGFYDWPLLCPEEEVTAMKDLASELRRDFDGALIFGIGGSYLGAATVQQALRNPEEEESFPIHWVSNVDPWAIEQAKYLAKKRKLAAVVISKSGGTTETLSGFFHLSRYLDPKGYVAITDPASGELRRMATEQGWRTFSVPPNVGGRYSVLTPVGLFPAFLMGLPAEGLLAGAREMHAHLDSEPALNNAAYLYAYMMFLWDTELGRNIQYLMPYRSNLEKLGDWYVQLWAESLGKARRASSEGVGPTPVAALGTADQHSILQLLKEGPRDKVVGFVDVVPDHGGTVIGEPAFRVEATRYLFPHTFEKVTSLASRAVQKSLDNSGVPTYRFELKTVDARTIGSLFFFFETACAFAGELYRVDAFDQPGVEEAKRILREAL